ncbi:occludin-like [Balaenoptera acutorostrata]|uniref:Occludin-like n=1 Tax=Balaenoptera acutorostrata TaxID=9767 RepID=A0A384AMP4_BALAC|nr:occludin-like [Balaenoptera acutorostrata]
MGTEGSLFGKLAIDTSLLLLDTGLVLLKAIVIVMVMMLMFVFQDIGPGPPTSFTESKIICHQNKSTGKSRRSEQDHYETDYMTGGESCDELEEDWIREYPPITSDQQRQLYKRNFDTGLQEYKSLQAELDEINKELSRLDKELDDYREESKEYMAAADEYNRLKQVKGSEDYKSKSNYCKQLKSKLSHIKKMVGDYDRRKT